MSLGIRFLDCNSVYVVVGAEGNNFQIWRDVVYNATADAVDVEVVGIHERHTAQEEDSASDFAQRLVGWREMHSHD